MRLDKCPLVAAEPLSGTGSNTLTTTAFGSTPILLLWGFGELNQFALIPEYRYPSPLRVP